MADVILGRYPEMHALVACNLNKEEDWRVNSSASALSGFAAAMKL